MIKTMDTNKIDPSSQTDDLNQIEDNVLVERSKDGDIFAYDELVQRYQGKIYSCVYNMTSNNEDAEDLVQDVFIKAFESLKKFKGKSSFYTWIYRIAINRTINYVKKRKRKQALSLNDDDLGIERDEAYIELSSKRSPMGDLTITELKEKLNMALQTLSDKHRTVVVLHDIEGVPHDEIAKIEGCSPGTVRSRLFYARQQLQAELAEYTP
ncbi:MAG: sigma-70 family RNA polymerase sigma factor [Verrucomicrobiota bacterium]